MRYFFRTALALVLGYQAIVVRSSSGGGSATPGGANLDVQCNISSALGACETGVFTHNATTHTTGTNILSATTVTATTTKGTTISDVAGNYAQTWDSGASLVKFNTGIEPDDQIKVTGADARVVDGGGARFRLYTATGLDLASDRGVLFANSAAYTGTKDLGLHRGGPSALEINQGTQGANNIWVSAETISGVANVGANSCGTSAATIAGKASVFEITVGATSGTQCRVAFTTAAPNHWVCVFADQTTTVAVRATPVDTTHTDAIGSFTAGDKISGICMAR